MYRKKRKDKEIKYTRGDKKRERERGEKGEHERVSDRKRERERERERGGGEWILFFPEFFRRPK